MKDMTLLRGAALAGAIVLACMVLAGPALARAGTPGVLAQAAPQSNAVQAAGRQPGAPQAGAPQPATPRPAAPQPATPITTAEVLLFQTNHLENIRAPATLTYAFHKAGDAEPGFDDKVQLILSKDKPAASLVFLSGPRQRQLPEVDNPEGNPVLLAFLERDIAEMHRLTGGASNYFRKRIRLALAEAAQVQPRRFRFAGKTIDGREVTIEPYRDDPMHDRFESYVGKRYSFILSADVPGGVYQVHAAVPGAMPGAAPGAPRPLKGAGPMLMDETLTLVSLEHGRR